MNMVMRLDVSPHIAPNKQLALTKSISATGDQNINQTEFLDDVYYDEP